LENEMMKKLIVLNALAVGLMAGPASAQMYMGAGVGQAKTSATETSYKVFGGFQLTPVWGVEAAYTDLGSYQGAGVQSTSIAGTGTMELSPAWSLFGKLGATSNRAHFSGASRHSDVLVGAGVGFNFGQGVGVRLAYEDFGKLSNVATGGNSRGRNLGLDVKYSF